MESGPNSKGENLCQNSETNYRPTSSCQVKKFIIMFILCGGLGAITSAIWYLIGWKSVTQLLIVAAVAFLITGRRYRWFYVALFTVKRDFM